MEIRINDKCKTCILLFVLISFFTSCRTESGWTFGTDYFAVKINKKGYITSMRNTTISQQKEFCVSEKVSPIMSLFNSKENCFYYPEEASYDKNNHLLKMKYSNGAVAKIRLQPHRKYIKLNLLDLTPRNEIDVIQWGPYNTSITNLIGEIIGVARDTSETVNYSIGVLGLDDNTLGGPADVEGDAAAFQYIIHTPDSARFPLPKHLHEGQVFTLGGNGISDVAFYANKEPYYRIMYGNSAQVDSVGRIYLNYHSRDRSLKRQIYYSLIPNMEANKPNHIDVEPVTGVDFIGSSIALWGSPDSIALMSVIRNIVLSENLPYPIVNGKWVKDPAAYVPDLMTSGNQNDSIISYASRLGFKSIYAYDQGFLRPDRGNKGYIDGFNFEKKTFQFMSGNKSHREFADMAATKNILLGRVNISNSLAPGTLDASPIPSDSLCYQQKRILMNDLTSLDTIIIVDDPLYLDEIASWEGHCEELNMIKIGKELIHYKGVTSSPPYTLLHVKRGYWGTKPSSHQKSDTIYKLQVTIRYGYDGLIPNIALQDKIAQYYADVSSINGIAHYDFDGQEFLFNNGHGYYSTKRFFRKMFERAEELCIPYIRVSGATLSEGSWHYQSVWNVGGGKNLYDLDTREWGSSTSQGKDLRDVTYSNYFPVSFGGNFPINKESTVEQFEHIEAMCVGYGATFYMRTNQKDVESCPQKDRIFNTIRIWENARAANAFPRSIKKLLMNPAFNWRLESYPDKDKWILYRMENGEKRESYVLTRAAGY